MTDFKALFAAMEERGILDKPIRSFEKHEIAELWLAFNEACTRKHRICARCKHHGWKEGESDPWCLHPAHETRMYSYTYQLACPDWTWWKKKEESNGGA